MIETTPNNSSAETHGAPFTNNIDKLHSQLTGISNHMPRKQWDKIIYPFPNFNGATTEVWEWISDFILLYKMDVITFPCWD